MYIELDGEKIFAWRHRTGTTQEKTARLAGVARNTLLRAENNRGAVRPRTALKIARVLDVEPRSLGRPKASSRGVGRP